MIMSEGRGARDRRLYVDSVEGASGAAALDGNHTGDLVSWLFPDSDWDGAPEAVDNMLTQLMYWTASGHLAWVVFPPTGFRI